jgi:hypothetical protein
MAETPEKTSLKSLTLANVKTLASLEKLLKTEATPQRDKKMLRVLKELEVVNDEAMRNGLSLSAQFIARVKTGRVRPQPPPTANQQRGADHAALMKFHFDHIKGPIADGAAQGAAIKFLLDHYSADVLKECYEALTLDTWRSKVTWITVKSEIGNWLARGKRNAPANATKADRSVEAARQAAMEFRNGTGDQ